MAKLADFCDRRKIDNIEDLLTAAQIATFSSRNPNVLSLLNYLLYRRESEQSDARRRGEPVADVSSVAFLQDTLQVLFGLLSSTMLPAAPNPAHEAIAGHALVHKGTSITTTNYDCCMDLALGEAGKDFEYGVDFNNVQSEAAPPEALTKLIKLHGSLNWFYLSRAE